MTDLRFGVSLAGWSDGPALLAAARTAERETAVAASREAAQHGMDWLVPELLLDTPFVLFAASAEDAAAELARRERRWGVRSWSTHAPWGPALARVAAAARA